MSYHLLCRDLGFWKFRNLTECISIGNKGYLAEIFSIIYLHILKFRGIGLVSEKDNWLILGFFIHFFFSCTFCLLNFNLIFLEERQHLKNIPSINLLKDYQNFCIFKSMKHQITNLIQNRQLIVILAFFYLPKHMNVLLCLLVIIKYVYFLTFFPGHDDNS